DIRHAIHFVAQFDVHRVTPVFALDRSAIDDRKSGQVVMEIAFDGLNGGEGLLDLFRNYERGVRQSLRIFRHGSRAKVISNQTSAADDNQSKRDRAGSNQRDGAEKIQRSRRCPVALVRMLRGSKVGYPPHFEAMSHLRETGRSLYGVGNAN